MSKPKLLEEVEALDLDKDLEEYLLTRALKIVQATPGGGLDWDDVEEWLSDAVELAHVVYRSWRDQDR